MTFSTPHVSRLIALAFAALGCLGMLPATSHGQMFLKIPDVEGESTDSRHPNEIEVLTSSWGVTNSKLLATNLASPLHDLTLTKWTDKATPRLMEAVCKGSVFTNAWLSFTRPGTTLEYYRLEMTKVRATSLAQSGSASADRVTERLGLRFATLKMDYVLFRPDGSPSGRLGWYWDDEAGAGGIYTNAPARTAPFVATLTFPAGSLEATITWPAVPGKSYRVSFTGDLREPFVPFNTYPAGGAQSLSITVPATKAIEFFRIEEFAP
jgi:type VI secretion system secreted protein Hcp